MNIFISKLTKEDVPNERGEMVLLPQRINGQEYDGTKINSREKQPLLSIIQPVLLHIYVYMYSIPILDE